MCVWRCPGHGHPTRAFVCASSAVHSSYWPLFLWSICLLLVIVVCLHTVAGVGQVMFTHSLVTQPEATLRLT